MIMANTPAPRTDEGGAWEGRGRGRARGPRRGPRLGPRAEEGWRRMGRNGAAVEIGAERIVRRWGRGVVTGF